MIYTSELKIELRESARPLINQWLEFEQAEPGLQSFEPKIGAEGANFIGGVVADAYMTNLALRLEVLQGAGGLLWVRQVVDAVQLIEVDIVSIEAS